MRKGIVIVGIVLLILGLLAITAAFLGQSQSTGIPASPSFLTYQPPSLVGSGTLTVTWSGGTSSTVVTVAPCSDSACSSINSGGASGSGASGTFSLGVQGGTTYKVNQSGNAGVSATFKTTGLVLADVIGIILIVFGAILAVVGFRAKAKVKADTSASATEASPSPSSAPVGESMGSGTEQSAGSATAAAAASALASPAGESRADLPPPNRSDTPPPTGPGGRPPIRCASCGTWNEPWLTNCRWCKRPLTSTGSA